MLKRLLQGAASERLITAPALSGACAAQHQKGGWSAVHPLHYWDRGLTCRTTALSVVFCKSVLPSQIHTSFPLKEQSLELLRKCSSLKEVFFSLFIFQPPSSKEMWNGHKENTQTIIVNRYSGHITAGSHRRLSLWLRGKGHSQIIKWDYVWFVLGS